MHMGQILPILEGDASYFRNMWKFDFPEMKKRFLTDEEFDHIFKCFDALWLHSGNPKHPHAKLTSGKCSDGFVDTLRVLHNVRMNELFAHQMQGLILKTFTEKYPSKDPYDGPFDKKTIFPNWIVGSDHASAVFSYEVSKIFRGCRCDFTEKGENETQIWKRFTIEPHLQVLQVEELITTTKTLGNVRNGIQKHHSYPILFIPHIFTLVHRSQQYEFENSPIHFLRHYDIRVWEPENCPLCKQGSVALKPKSHWKELTNP